MSITFKSTLAGALCGAFVFAIAPADLGWAQDDCNPPCPICKSGDTCIRKPIGHGQCSTVHCEPILGNLPAPTSALGVALVSVGKEVYVFETAGDPNIKGHVLYTFFQTGGANRG